MKTAILALALTTICIGHSSAADTVQKGQGMTVEQKKAEIIQHIQDRIANSQAELECVKIATSHEQLMTCRDKYRPKRQQSTNDRRSQNPLP